MDKKKILFLGIVLLAIGICVAGVSAKSGDIIKMGDISSSELTLKNSKESTSFPGEYELDYSIDAKIDISGLSDADKELLNKAVKDKKTSLIINVTASNFKVSTESFKTIKDISINGNTLQIKDDFSFSSPNQDETVELEAISLNQTGTLFVAEQ